MASETLEDKKQEEIANVEDKDEMKEEGKTEEGEEEKEAEKKEEDTEMAEKEEEDEEKEEPEVKGEESKEEAEEVSKKAKRGRKGSSKKAAKDEKAAKSGPGSKEPVTPIERPIRERKTAERYSEPSTGRSASKALSIKKVLTGQGTQLKDIPNVIPFISGEKGTGNGGGGGLCLSAIGTYLFILSASKSCYHSFTGEEKTNVAPNGELETEAKVVNIPSSCSMEFDAQTMNDLPEVEVIRGKISNMVKNEDSGSPSWSASLFMQTIEDVARAVAAAAAAATTVRSPRPYVPPEVKSGTYNPEVLTSQKRQWASVQLQSLEPLEGKIITKLPSSISHNGIRLTVNGSVTLQVRGGSAGVIESLYGVLKPIPIVLGLMFVGGLVLAYASEHLGIGSFLRGFEEHMFLMLIFLGFGVFINAAYTKFTTFLKRHILTATAASSAFGDSENETKQSDMRIQHPGVPILIVMMLAISLISNGRHIHRITTEESSTDKFNWKFSQHFSAEAPEESRNNEADPVYQVSHRTVPGGPNPLHN
ncbi:hypothetical protein HYC85_022890 [Camellia sinensis]|uniref:Uncharacterized protein n=1 Tax=Camellia sinensis TaxID=4442 RepID=A0A7J7GFA6_CAMSI|nr:hypothetical protein HYC85_022890 [Camellia sinensis]